MMNDRKPPRPGANRRWLCVAYAFPPISRSGVHRTLGFVRHMDRIGRPATVLTVRPDGESIDESLWNAIPESTKLIRTSWLSPLKSLTRVRDFLRLISTASKPERGALACRNSALPASRRSSDPRRFTDWATRLLTTPDSRIGWIPLAVPAGWNRLRRERHELIYSTSPYASAHLIAAILSRIARLPWIADFRDPWIGNAFREPKYRSLERWDAWLERTVFRGASQVIFNSPKAREDACRRAPFLAEKSSTILNGFDEDSLPGLKPLRLSPAGDFVLTHAGEFYGPRNPEPCFRAVASLRKLRPDMASRLKLVLIGPPDFGGVSLAELAGRHGIADLVTVAGRLSHAETLARIAGSDAVMLVGQTGRGSELQIPNKLYEYLALRRPILACVHENSPVVAVLRDAGAEAAIAGPDDPDGLCHALVTIISRRFENSASAWHGVPRYALLHSARLFSALCDAVKTRESRTDWSVAPARSWSLPRAR